MYSPAQGGGGRPKQSRIVINVDEAKQKGTRGGGVRRPLSGRRRTLAVVGLVIVGALLVALIGSFLWWQSYKKSPGYSLALLAEAAGRDDTQAVEQLLDTERVAQSLAPQVLDKAMASAGGMGALAAPRKQIEAALPNLLPALHDQVRGELVRGVKEASAKSGKIPFFLKAVGMSRMWDSLKEEGDTALIVFKHADNTAPTELTMQRDGDHWKVVGLKDEQLATGIAARVVSSLAAQPVSNRPPENNKRRKGNH
jgi:hypothetical protein